MSPQSKGRKRKKSAARGRKGAPGSDVHADRILADAVHEMAAATDATQAELYVSVLLGAWWGKVLVDADPEVVFGEELVARAARKRLPGAVGLLRVIAVLGTQRQREQAAAGADALVAGGVDEPAWVPTLGTERAVEAWAYGDVYGDQSTVLLVVERGGARHALVALVDHTVGGMVEEAFFTEDPDAARADLRDLADEHSVVEHELSLGDAAAVLVPAFAVIDSAAELALEPPVGEEFAASRALAAARLRLLPTPVEPVPALPDEASRAAVVDEFLTSHDLPPGARGCAGMLVEFGAAVSPARPLRIGPGMLDQFLDETLNDGPPVSQEELEALPETLRAWADWAGRRAGLPEAALAELADEVDDMVGAIGGPGDADPVPYDVPDDVVDAYLAGLDLESLNPQDLPDVLARRMFAVPGVATRIGDQEFSFLDPGDPDDRSVLIKGEHPEYHEALADPDTDTVEGVNPRLHITVHEIVANQLWADDPPQVWQAARRLLATGAERHDVLHAIADVLVEHLHGLLTGQGDGDVAPYIAGLEQLGRGLDPDPVGEADVIPLRRKR
ncbi:DUF1841 family protein [Pseudonocardia sp. MH-G8]|uniref:DUF1841 family protein n=1 Tax=Pseudonocardia sp. MH-G8 TaxID=1854588 RepID=UPI000BA0C5FB|nr:DUF1841 family protein [Pseudonocardia sp. MH-G8]OZM81817.1 hypothetical protein CFP66_12790 [Pseudonocardia sp. MH-G8]